jgi:hypothetical protein
MGRKSAGPTDIGSFRVLYAYPRNVKYAIQSGALVDMLTPDLYHEMEASFNTMKNGRVLVFLL